MKYSVVVPVFNSADSLIELHERLAKVLTNLSDDYEIIFVDDGSVDSSWDVLRSIKTQAESNVLCVRLAKNYGQHNATFCGLKFATGERIITIDDDLQYFPEDITVMVDAMNETKAHLIYGHSEDNHSVFKKAASTAYKSGSKYLDGKHGLGSSFRLFDARLKRSVLVHEFQFVFLDELFSWYTDDIGVVKVRYQARRSGKSGYDLAKSVKLANRNTLNYSSVPLRFMTYGGAVFAAIFFLLAVWFIVKKLMFGTKVPGFTAMIVAISFSISVMLLCFGVIGKYLNMIITRMNEKPTYSIKDELL